MAQRMHNTTEQARDKRPIRLTYEVTITGRIAGVVLVPRLGPTDKRLTEGDLKRLSSDLHVLDAAIVRELRSGVVFGQLDDASFARLLPLLAQRQATLGGEPLRFDDEPLVPRIRVRPGRPGRVRIEIGLQSDHVDWTAVAEGRLVTGSQAFFVRGRDVYEIESRAPWELTAWAKTPVLETDANITPLERDRMVRELTKAGVPASDLDALAVRRAAPNLLRVRFSKPRDSDPQPCAVATLEAQYGADSVPIDGFRTQEVYVVPTRSDGLGLVERDLMVEDDARRRMRRIGFRYDKTREVYIARGETAIRVLDPESEVFPADWVVVRDASAPRFRRDLEVRATLALQQSKGLLDLSVGIDAVDDDETVAALVEMKDLLGWLGSGKRYVQLPDGSYVAPSSRFKQSLRLLDDMGAEKGRALVSPLCVGLLRALGDSEALAAADAATSAWLRELSGASAPATVQPPPALEKVMREYQCRGVDWLAMLHRHQLTGILADDMGLGKTLQTLALLITVRNDEGPKPSLVVAPTSVVAVWRDEITRFTPELGVALYHGTPTMRREIDPTEFDVVVTSYGILRRDAERLSSIPFRYVILDEAQAAKNAASQNARAIRRLQSERRLALTGTPVENRPEELWATFDFLAPGFLGTLRQFRKRYARPIAQGDEDALGLLRARITPLVLRRLKSEVAKELPPKVETTVRSEMLAAQRALYEHVAGELRESVERKIEKVGIERAHLDILAALTRLRQICCDPALLPAPKGAKVPGSAKLELFEELMREALASERHVVVFSQFVQMQKRLISVIKKLGVEPLWLHGGTRRRDKVIDAFQTPSGPPVIVVSLRAGGTGLTLTRADTVMHYDPWWNPAVEHQASDRVHRIGQMQRVTVYKLVCARSIEERVLQLAEKKDALANNLLGSEGGMSAKRISSEDVLALLQ